MALNRNILSLFELTSLIQSNIQQNMNSLYWVKAELVKLNFYPQSGHCYPELVEKESNRIKAQIRGIIWRNDFAFIDAKFRKVAKMQISQGMQLLFQVQVTYSPVYGLSLIIFDIDPTYTLGALAQERIITMERLKNEGVVNLNKLLPVPLLMQRIAIISVASSKGYNDFMQTILNYKDDYSVVTKLYPAILQGDTAIPSLISAFNLVKDDAEKFDAVFLIRGGGGDIGMNCYDNYNLAHIIATFPIPVVTGIGHSTDSSIADLVAAFSMKTPTEAANLVISKFISFDEQLSDLQSSIIENAKDKIEMSKNIVQSLSTGIAAKVKPYLVLRSENINRISKDISKKMPQLIDNHNKKCVSIVDSISRSLKLTLNNNYSKLDNFEVKVKLLSPEYILKKGYSISYYDGEVIRDSTQVVENKTIETILYKGKIESKIVKIEKNGR